MAGPVVGGPGGAWGIVLFVGASGFHKDDLPLRRDATVIVVFQLRSGYAEADVDNLPFDLSRGRVGAGEVLIGEEERPLFEGSGAVLYEKDDGTGGVHGGVGGRELLKIGPAFAAGADTPLLQPIRNPLGGQAVLGGSGKPSSELGGGELLGVSQKGVAGNVVKPFQKLLLSVIGSERGEGEEKGERENQGEPFHEDLLCGREGLYAEARDNPLRRGKKFSNSWRRRGRDESSS